MKKGFTLIELMAVIFILGVIGTIAVVAVDKTIKDNKESLYQIQISNIEAAARLWGDSHIDLIPDENGDALSIPLLILKQDGLLDKEYKNPKNDKLFFDNMYIDISYENGVYIYNVIEDSGTTNYSDLSYPAIILKEKFNYTEALVDYEVYISSIDKEITSATLSVSNEDRISTMEYTERGKTFEVVRKEKTD